MWREVVVGAIWLATAAAAPQGLLKARPLSADEISQAQSRMQPAPVPGRSGPIVIERAQAFAVQGPDFGSFWLAPVRYPSHDAGGKGDLARCGVFLLQGTGDPQFVPTVGYGWMEAESCTGLKGVGFVEALGGPPRILLLYAAASPNYPAQEPVVLDWDAKSSRYAGNEKLSRRLEDDDKATSIPAIKRQLKTY